MYTLVQLQTKLISPFLKYEILTTANSEISYKDRLNKLLTLKRILNEDTSSTLCYKQTNEPRTAVL